MNRPFQTGGDRTKVAEIALIAAASLSVLLAIARWLVAHKIGVEIWTGAQDIALILCDFLQLVAIVAFAAWLLRAYTNLEALNAPTRYTPMAALAFFYLPLVSFFLPQAILQEIWTKSRANDPRAKSPIRDTPAPWFELWWYVFIVYSAAHNIAAARLLRSDDQQPRGATGLLFFAAFLAIAAASGGVIIIRRIDHRQKTRRMVMSARQTSASVVAEPAPKRSAIRDLVMPIVSMVEEEKASLAEETEHAVEGAGAPLRSLLSNVNLPSRKGFEAGSVFVVVCAVILIFAAALHAFVSGLLATRRAVLPEMIVAMSFFGPFAFLEYLFALVTFMSWKFWDPSLADDDIVESFQRWSRIALGSALAAGLLALGLPARVTGIVVVLVNLIVIWSAVLLCRVAFSVAAHRAQLLEMRQSAVPQ